LRAKSRATMTGATGPRAWSRSPLPRAIRSWRCAWACDRRNRLKRPSALQIRTMGREGVLYMLGRRKKDAYATDGGWGRHLSQRIGIDCVHVSQRLISGLDLETSVAERKTIGTAHARIETRNVLRRIGRRERLQVVGQCR